MSDNSTETLNESNDQRLDQILAALQGLDSRMQRLEAYGPELGEPLKQLETKVDERLRETRPIWEAVTTQLTELKESVLAEGQSRQAQIAQLQQAERALYAEMRELLEARIAEVKESTLTQIDDLRVHISELKESQESFRAEMEKSFRLLDRRMEMHSGIVSRVHAYQRDLEDRVDELAKRSA